MRLQYERDRLGYFHSRYKGHELFSIDASVDDYKFLEYQLALYTAIFKVDNSDSLEEKKTKIQAYLSQFHIDLNEVQDQWNKVKEKWLTSSNHIHHVDPSTLREVEANTRAGIELLENELDRLQGQLPPKESDGTPGSSQRGSDMGKTNPQPLVNKPPPTLPTSPTIPVHSRVVPKGGMQVDSSSADDSYSSTDLSESAMAINDRLKHDVRSASPFLLPQTTYRDPGKTKHSVERAVDRSTRQSLAPETLSDPSVAKSDKRVEQVQQPTIGGLHPDEFPGYDPTIKQEKASRKRYSHSPKKDADNKKFDNFDETAEDSDSSQGPVIIDPTTMASELRTNSTMSSSSSSRAQSVSGIGLPKWQDINGWRETIRSSQKQEGNEKKFKKSWFNVNDSLSMPAQPSSFIRTDRRAGDQPSSSSNNSITSDFSSLFGAPTQPFQRTKRGVARPESTPVGKLRTKPGLSDISRVAMKQERSIAQPLSQMSSMTHQLPSTGGYLPQGSLSETSQTAPMPIGTKIPLTSSYKESKINTTIKKAEDEDIKVRTQTVIDDLERSTLRLKELNAAHALIQMSRMGDKDSNLQQQQQQGLAHSRTDDIRHKTAQSSEAPGPSGHQDGPQSYGGLQYGGPVHSTTSQYNTMPYGPDSYGHQGYHQGYAQRYDPAQQYGYPQQPHPMYAMGPPADQAGLTYYRSSFQRGHQTAGHRQMPHMDQGPQHGAIGSEMQAMEQQQVAQEEQTFVRSQKAREQKETTNMDKSTEANNNPFVD